jgi:hypothetical protein
VNGTLYAVQADWLRWISEQGKVLAMPSEDANAERARANEEAARANEEAARADRLARELEALKRR